MNLKKNIKDYYTIFKEIMYKLDLIIYLSIILCFFLLFQHEDLYHTVISSYSYLYGHVSDFYEYNKVIVGGNDYLPLIYIIFAVWNIPLKCLNILNSRLGLLENGIHLTLHELYWNKILLVILFFAVGFVIYKISCIINENKKKSVFISILFFTSPLSMFAVFIFGQYDIIQLFFAMIGILFYYKKNLNKFSFFMSIAISLKFFPILIFIPLLLLYEKRLIYIIKYIIIVLSFTTIQILFYIKDEVFVSSYFGLANSKLSEIKTLSISQFNNPKILILVFLLVCVYCYIKNLNTDKDWYRISIFVSIFIYATLFATVTWHPQWLIIIVPFLALSYNYINDWNKSFIFDIIGSIAFIYFVVYFFSTNVDVSMIKNGILRNFINYIPLLNRDFIIYKFVEYASVVFMLYLYIPLFFLFIDKNTLNSNKFSNNILRLRYSILIFTFLIPSLVCTFASKEFSRKINPLSYTKKGVTVDNMAIAIPILKGNNYKQTFIAEENNLSIIRLRLGIYGRKNNEKIFLKLYDSSGKNVRESEIGTIKEDNQFNNFKFEPIKNSEGKEFVMEIYSNASIEENNFNAVWCTDFDVYPFGEFIENGNNKKMDMSMELRYEMY